MPPHLDKPPASQPFGQIAQGRIEKAHRKTCRCCSKKTSSKPETVQHRIVQTEFVGKYSSALLDFAMELERKSFEKLFLSNSTGPDSSKAAENVSSSSADILEFKAASDVVSEGRPFKASKARRRADDLVQQALDDADEADYDDTICATQETEWSAEADGEAEFDGFATDQEDADDDSHEEEVGLVRRRLRRSSFEEWRRAARNDQ